MGSWDDLNGPRCRRASGHLPSLTLNPVSGPTAGNTMHPPLLNTTSGRSLCCASRVLPTRRIFGRTLGCPAPHLLRTLILERLRLPLFVCEVRCECGFLVDGQGRHRVACPHSGRLHTRASAPERTLARVCREAGASVRFNAKLVDMNIAVPANDARAVEVLASGLPLFHGAQLAVDITLRSVLTATVMLRPGAAVVDGIVCMAARADKELKYSKLLCGDRCRLVVVALETCGRWSPEAVDFIERLAMARARDAPPNLQRSAFLSWRRRWICMIAISCGRSFANTLVSQSSHFHALAGVKTLKT